MKDLKLDGYYHRIFKGNHGLYGVETVKLEKGKVVEIEEMSPNYPTVAMAMFGKRAMAEAHDMYSKSKMLVAKG
jgi:hypothetical protein